VAGKTRAYPKEFREDAVRLYRTSGKSLARSRASWASPSSRFANGSSSRRSICSSASCEIFQPPLAGD
jgi:hypothetical protein